MRNTTSPPPCSWTASGGSGRPRAATGPRNGDADPGGHEDGELPRRDVPGAACLEAAHPAARPGQRLVAEEAVRPHPAPQAPAGEPVARHQNRGPVPAGCVPDREGHSGSHRQGQPAVLLDPGGEPLLPVRAGRGRATPRRRLPGRQARCVHRLGEGRRTRMGAPRPSPPAPRAPSPRTRTSPFPLSRLAAGGRRPRSTCRAASASGAATRTRR